MTTPRLRTVSARAALGEGGFGALTVIAILVGIPVVLALALALALGLSAILASERLPSMEALTDYRPKVPLRIYTADGVLIGEFGEERRSVVKLEDVPPVMTRAILAAEDDRFFTHSGVDFLGIARAAFANLAAGGKAQGASTITMQLARNFFLSNERSYTRKIYEILVALKIEQALSKEQILEIYLNQIYLGQRAYGFASASQVYFGKPLAKITAAEAAMLAGLPKAPSAYNPVVNPKRAKIRQQYILGRMRSLGYLTEEQYQSAIVENLALQPDRTDFALKAPYVAELARQLAYEQFREETYIAGLNVYTTVRSDDQRAANLAVRRGIIDYDRRYGYRGPEAQVDLPADPARREEKIEEALLEAGEIDGFTAAVITQVSPQTIRASRSRGQTIDITGDGLKFVAGWIAEKASADKRLKPGSVIRLTEGAKGWEVSQLPEVQAAGIATGQAATVRLTALPDQVLRGKVAAVLPEANRDTRTLRLRIELPNPGQRLKAGMFAQVSLGGAQREMLVVPAEAVIRTGRRALVYVAEEAGRYRPVARRRPSEAQAVSEPDPYRAR